MSWHGVLEVADAVPRHAGVELLRRHVRRSQGLDPVPAVGLEAGPHRPVEGPARETGTMYAPEVTLHHGPAGVVAPAQCESGGGAEGHGDRLGQDGDRLA